MNIIDFFSLFLPRLGLALLLGAVVGFERESHEHAAGIRTNALVAIGSCLFTLISAYGFIDLIHAEHLSLDPTRIASYVIAGIGFMCAGSIFLNRDTNQVNGLTTAASVWLVAAIGMACGAGLIWVAIATTILALFVLIVLRIVEHMLLPRQFLVAQHLHIEAPTIGGQLVGQVCDTLARSGIMVGKLEIHTEQGIGTVIVACHIPDATVLAQVVGELQALPEVRAVQANMRGLPNTKANSLSKKERHET